MSIVTAAQKAKVMYSVLTCAPMTTSKPDFRKYSEAGDVQGLWSYYQNSMKARRDIRDRVETGGQISFEMLKPAMETIYGLPTEDDSIPL